MWGGLWKGIGVSLARRGVWVCERFLDASEMIERLARSGLRYMREGLNKLPAARKNSNIGGRGNLTPCGEILEEFSLAAFAIKSLRRHASSRTAFRRSLTVLVKVPLDSTLEYLFGHKDL